MRILVNLFLYFFVHSIFIGVSLCCYMLDGWGYDWHHCRHKKGDYPATDEQKRVIDILLGKGI